MSHSHDHHHADHGHGHGDHHDAHDHSDDIEPVLQSLLWKQIEFEKIITLNESETDAGAKVVEKSWSQRMNSEPVLISDADEQILMTVPFAGSVKLHSILIRTSDSDTSPRTLKVFVNRNDLDFSAASELTPTQVLTLSRTSEIQDLPVKRAFFGNTYCLTLFFEDSYGADSSEIFYLGFKGDFTKLHREPVEVLYEKAANPKDHAPTVGINNMAAHGRSGM